MDRAASSRRPSGRGLSPARFVVTVGFLAWLGLAGGAAAQYIAHEVSGVVLEVDDEAGFFEGALTPLTSFSAQIFYRDDLFDANPTPEIGHFHYEAAIDYISTRVDVGGFVFETDPWGLAEIDIRDGVEGHDRFWIIHSAVLSDDFELRSMDMMLTDPTATVFDDSALPLDLPVEAFAGRSFDLTAINDTSVIRLDVESIVSLPEPAIRTLVPVGGAMLAAFGSCRVRRNRCRIALGGCLPTRCD